MSVVIPQCQKSVILATLPDCAPGVTARELAEILAPGDDKVRERMQIALASLYLSGKDVDRVVSSGRSFSYWKIEGYNSHRAVLLERKGSKKKAKRKPAKPNASAGHAPQPVPEPERPREVERSEPLPSSQSLAEVAFKPVAAIIDNLSDALARMLIERTLAKVNDRLPLAMASFLSSSSDAGTAKEEPAEPKRRTKVAVVGLLPAQEKMIAEQFSGDVAFSFPEKNNSRQLKQAAVNSEYVVMMAAFVNHSTQNTLKSKGANLIIEHGGMDALRRQISVITKSVQHAQNQARH